MKRLEASNLISMKRFFIFFLLTGLLTLVGSLPDVRAAAAPGAGLQETEVSEAGTPEVTAVDPSCAVQGSALIVKVTGKNFGKGAKISFANPDIKVMETNDLSPTELAARIQVASKAATGTTSLYVTNPNYRQAELPFEVTVPGASKPATTAGASATNGDLRFEVIYIKGKKILTPTKLKGILTYSKGKLRLEESGKEVFNLTRADIKEIGMNTLAGVSTNSFHIILATGKKFDFWAASLKPADTKAIAEALQRAMP